MQEIAYLWRFGRVEFDEGCWELRLAGQCVTLERKPLALLSLLLRHAGEVVTKEELLGEVWSGRVVVDAALTNAVAKLRRALAEDGKRLILVPRVGYRLIGSVTRKPAAIRPPPSALVAGDSAPRRPGFQLVQRLGKNLDCEVWSARQVGTQIVRVFKFSMDGSSLSTLKREVTLYRLLRDSLGPRDEFVRLLDWDFEQAPYFLELEFGGQRLDKWLEENLAIADRRTRLKLLADIADAVATAHEVGVLHKDLKPSNVLVYGETGAWHPRIADFGSGRATDPQRLEALGITQMELTQRSLADGHSGTLGYIAPEIFGGHSPSIGSDIYALGVIAYQLIVGDFRRALVPGWESDIDDMLLRKDISESANGDPSKRPVSARILAERLRSIELRRTKSIRQQVLLIAGAFLLIIAGTGGSVYYAAQARRQAVETAEQVLVSRFRSNPTAQVQILTLMAEANAKSGHRKLAAVQYEKAVQLLDTTPGASSEAVLGARLQQATNLLDMGNEPAFNRALAPVLHAAESDPASSAHLRVGAWLLAARAAQRGGRAATELHYLNRARSFLVSLPDPDPLLVVRVSAALKSAHAH